jgi:N-acetyl-gamma-glutamyl-phosphate reductase
VSVGIFGASGTTGVEVARLCHDHPVCRIAFATSRTHAGEPLRIVDPAAPKLRLVHPDDVELDAIDVAFVCLPHGRAAAVVARCADAGLRVIDLSGDLRLRDAELHRRVYGT